MLFNISIDDLGVNTKMLLKKYMNGTTLERIANNKNRLIKGEVLSQICILIYQIKQLISWYKDSRPYIYNKGLYSGNQCLCKRYRRIVCKQFGISSGMTCLKKKKEEKRGGLYDPWLINRNEGEEGHNFSLMCSKPDPVQFWQPYVKTATEKLERMQR